MYLLTRSDHYYPMAGTSDWLSIHASLEDATEEYEIQKLSTSSSATLYLIDVESKTVLEYYDGDNPLI